MHIGEEIRRRREEQGLTGFQLAVKAGMTPSAVSQIETGKRTPNSASVVKLATALGVEVGELYPKAQEPLPFDESLISRREVQEWLREQGHMTEEEFLAWAEDLDLDLDEDGFPQGIESGISELRLRRDALIDALRTPEARKALFPIPSGLSKEETKNWLLKPPGRWELMNDIRREYLARELTLVNYSRQLFAEGETSDYLVYGRLGWHDRKRHQLLEKERRRVLEESYAKAVAV
jgi:transcriptional regulator with XRE-family HTH domain